MTRRIAPAVPALLLALLAGCGGGTLVSEGSDLQDALSRGKADGLALALRINEVMATPIDERRGEYIEVYNDSPAPADLSGLIVDDGDRQDVLFHVAGPDTVPGFGYGLIVDPDWEAALPEGVAIYSVGDHALGNGLSASDPVTLATASGLVLDRVAPRPTPRGAARERKAPLLADRASSWRVRPGGSPGHRNLYAPSERLRFHVTYVGDEAETVDALRTFIEAAEVSLDCAIYQMDHPAILQAFLDAHRRGVTVRIVTDSTFFDRPDYHAGYEPLLDAGIPIVPDQRSSEQHNKFLVADGHRVWLGSYNPTTHVSADAAVEFESPSLARELIREVDDMMSGHFGVSKRPTEFADHIVDGTPVTLLASPTDGVQKAIVAALRRARHSIHFLAFGLTADAIGDALLERASAGVEVHGAIDWLHATRRGSEWARLVAAGLDVRRSPHAMLMHQKLIVIDGGTPDAVVIVGSYNFTERAETRNDETMLVLRSPRLAATAEDAITTVVQASEPVGNATLPALVLTEVAQGEASWVEIENRGAGPIALDGIEVTNLEAAASLSGTLPPGARAVVDLDLTLSGSDPVFLRDRDGHVIDAIATHLVAEGSHTWTRTGPVSWSLADATPGF